eukprot:scaffold16286_cov124-Isochrysis_galbana.AAC.2
MAVCLCACPSACSLGGAGLHCQRRPVILKHLGALPVCGGRRDCPAAEAVCACGEQRSGGSGEGGGGRPVAGEQAAVLGGVFPEKRDDGDGGDLDAAVSAEGGAAAGRRAALHQFAVHAAGACTSREGEGGG